MGSHAHRTPSVEGGDHTDPWALPPPRRLAGLTPWLLPACAGVAATVAASVLIARWPDERVLHVAMELPAATAGLVLAAAPAEASPGLAPAAEVLDKALARLQSAVDQDGLDPAAVTVFRGQWAQARPRLADPAQREVALATLPALVAASASVVPQLQAQIDSRRRDAAWALGGLGMVLALALALPAVRLWRQRLQLRSSLHQFSDGLGSGAWRDAVHHLRAEALGAPSAFDALATGVESVLGESERRWQALADLSADWYWETDRNGCLTWLSASAPQAMVPGLGPEAMLGRRHDQIAAFRAPAKGWAVLHGCMAREEAFRDLEFQAQGARQTRWLSISGRPRRDADGRLLGYEGVGRDITERRIAHERLVASEQRWSTMTRLAADWYWQTDARHRLLPLSPDQYRRLGPALAEQLEGRTRWDALPKALTPAQWAEHRADLDARRPFRSLQLEVDAGDGRELWLSLSGLPRFDLAGGFIGYHGVGRDITARKQAERLLLRHNEELQRAVAERTRDLAQVNLDLEAFARQLAHELRTPLGHVKGLADLLRDRATERLRDDERELLQLQAEAVQRMTSVVGALLEMARSTLVPMPAETVDLSALVHEVIDELPPRLRRAPVQWHVAPDVQVQANRAALKIVLGNLLGNAAKFTRDTAAPCVRVEAALQADGRLGIAVSDNGPGFEPEQAARLFRPFGQLHKPGDHDGVGLGLNIVQRIVERHGGRVSARGRPAEGACFEFTLAPAARPAAAGASGAGLTAPAAFPA